MTITLGWWALPALFTLALLVWAMARPAHRGGDYSFDVVGAFLLLAGLIAALVAWLIWALAT